MKAIKLAILGLAAGVLLVTQVTAGEVAFNFQERTTQFYSMPGEPLPTKEQIAEYCPPGWTYELYRWTRTEDNTYTSSDAGQGQCPGSDIEVPANPADKFGI